MKEYMVTFKLPSSLSQKFTSLIPAQRETVNQLFKHGALTSYTLAADYSVLWATVLADSEENAMDIIAKLPLTPFMKIDIHELLFHDRARVVLPKVSLN